ncbi:HupE/UreJ family protein [Microbulbifer echini]|uniref:HupE/UreJ family protein n=1 Tax=Microbulbifer echini TaxID=1529067 RepID=A0ABV4NNN3_9GAMM
MRNLRFYVFQFLSLTLVLCMSAQPQSAEAHLLLNPNVITPHIEHRTSGINLSMRLPYAANTSLEEYRLSSARYSAPHNQEKTKNLTLNYRPGKMRVIHSKGLVQKTALISYTNLDTIQTFLRKGIVHIIGGLDHVLFVLCLSLGALTLPLLLWRITGFAIGHSITLSAGIFGFIPVAVWFIPLVETGIALSIIYMAWLSLRVKPTGKTSNEHTIFFTTCLLGLLHGLGFSFVLQEILKLDSPNLWQSLLAFNLGVEVGQIFIILAIWPLFYLARHWQKNWEAQLRYSIATICVAIAVIWAFERGAGVISVIQQKSKSNINIVLSSE